jgi:uncharacterized membrane protein YphA (DoxX/SURF4 family)
MSSMTNKAEASALAPKKFGNQVSIGWQVALWAAQILLCVVYGASGVMNSSMSVEALMTMGMTHAGVLPHWLLRFLGISELAGCIGIILPALTRIKPILTPLAALGFTAIQILAIGFHIERGEFAKMAPINAALIALSLFVLWGRIKKAPIAPRWRRPPKGQPLRSH